MADGSVTVTGLAELRRAVDTFDQTLTLQLRAIAFRKAREVKDSAIAILNSKIHGHGKPEHQRTADSLVIHEDAEHKRFFVRDENPTNPNLGLWIERGTIYKEARPFMRPAGDAITPSYRKEMTDAAEAAGVNLGTF